MLFPTSLATVISVLTYVLHAQSTKTPSTPTSSIPRYKPKCTNGVLARREWRTLTSSQQQDYLNSLRKLQQRPSPDKPSTFDRLSKLHSDLATPKAGIHSTPLFFPFHRLFVHYYERELQRFSPTLTIPFWNTGYDSQAPELSPVWDERTFGTNGVPEKNYCVMDGVFKTYRPFFPKDHCLQRNWTTLDTIGAFHSTDMINKILSTAKTYEAFRRGMEFAPHGVVHTNIGGDMSTMLSPNEPIFWLHHSNIDRLWDVWQRSNSTNLWKYDGKNADGTAANLNNFLPGAKNIRVGDVFDTKSLCYTYVDMKVSQVKKVVAKVPSRPSAPDQVFNARRRLYRRSVEDESDELDLDQELSAWNHLMQELDESSEPLVPLHTVSIAASKNKNVKMYKQPKNAPVVKPSDRSNLLALRIPTPLPDSWLRMNGLPVANVRAQEIAVANVTKELNDLEGYVSPSAIWNQQDKMAKLVDKVNNFVADVNGTRIVVNVTHSNTIGDSEKVKQIVNSVKQSTSTGQLQQPINKVAANLTDIIGPPVLADKDAASNPFAPRHQGEQGFTNKDSEKLLDKVEQVKDKKRDLGLLTPKKDKENKQKENKIDLALGGGAKSTPNEPTAKQQVSIKHLLNLPVWIPSNEWQG